MRLWGGCGRSYQYGPMDQLRCLVLFTLGARMADYYFVSYSSADAKDATRQLADKLEGEPPNIPVWLGPAEALCWRQLG
jgi:hypothetical protein